MAICSFAVVLEPGAAASATLDALRQDARVTLGCCHGWRLPLMLEVPDQEGEEAGEWLRAQPGVRSATLVSAYYTDQPASGHR